MSQGVGPATDNPVAYISHHLQPLTAGSGFWQINIDTMFFSILIMLGVMTVGYKVGRNVTAGAPTGMQNVLETFNRHAITFGQKCWHHGYLKACLELH